MEIQKVKISDLPVTEDLNGLKTLGTTAENTSKAAELTFIADAATSANEAATNANQAAENANTSAANADAKAEAAQKAANNATASANQADQAAVNANTATTRATAAAEKAENAADVAIGVVNEAQQATANANQAAQSANEAATNANQAAASANDAATEAHTQAEYAKTQGDYAKAEGDRVLAEKGQPGGLAELDERGRVPSSQLPSYVDDVINVATYSQLPNPGESGKIYITEDTNLTYRWSGTGYAEISPSLALGTTAETAGRGDWTHEAYNHSLIKDGSNPHKTTFASLPDKPSSLPPSGSAGGDLAGTYPNPTIGAGKVTTAKIADGAVIAAKLAEQYIVNRGAISNLNNATTYGFYTYDATTQNAPTSYGSVLVVEGTGREANWVQLALGYSSGDVNSSIFIRYRQSYTVWAPWVKVWDSGNFNPNDYLPLSGNKMITGDFQLKDGIAIRDVNNNNVVGLLNIVGDGSIDVALGNSVRKTRIVTPNDTPVYRNDSKGTYRIYDSSNFNPDNYLNAKKGLISDLNTATDSGVYYFSPPGSVNTPENYGSLLVVTTVDNGSPWINQFAFGTSNKIWHRQNINNAGWNSWEYLYDSSNLGNATTSKAGLMSAADKTKLDGLSGGGLNIPASGEVAISGWTYNGKQVYAQRWTGSFGSGFNTTVTSQFDISAFLSLYGDVKLGDYNYPIGGSVWNRATGEDIFKSSFIYKKGATNNLSIEHWTAMGGTTPTTYEVFAIYTK